MARNGSGVYSLAGAFPSNGDVSDVSDLTTNFTDLESDANTARPVVAGGTGAATAKAARTNLLFAKGADVASASALSLGGSGNYFDVTGTTTVTSISTWNVGDVVRLHFDAALTLTHHATNLILPGAANITTAAGDEAEFVEYASGQWRCTSYQRADGTILATAIDGVPIGGTTPAAGDFTTLGATGAVSVAADIQHTGDTDNKISFATDTQDFQTGGSSRLDISDSGVRLGGANARVTTVLDEDTMSSDSATALATQQSIKAYADSAAAGVATLGAISQNLITSASATIDITGLSSYSVIIASLAGQGSAGADLLIRARASAGTWRTLQTYSGLIGSPNDRVLSTIVIENFGNGDSTGRRNYSSSAFSDNNTLTFSASETEGTATAKVGFSARAETWDEIRFEVSAGTLAANASEVKVSGA